MKPEWQNDPGLFLKKSHSSGHPQGQGVHFLFLDHTTLQGSGHKKKYEVFLLPLGSADEIFLS